MNMLTEVVGGRESFGGLSREVDFSTQPRVAGDVVLGPLGHYHLLPDSVLGTLVLVVVLTGIFYAYTGRPLRGHRFTAVGLLVGTNLLVFLLQGLPLGQTMVLVPSFYLETRLWNMLIPVLVVAGYTWWSPLTSMFMHGSMLHILGNMLLLWILGVKVEERVGRRGFVVLYLVSGLFADAITLLSIYAVPPGTFDGSLFHIPSPTVPNLGASGAVYGLVGFSIFAFPREKILVPTPIIMTFWPAWAAAIFYVLFNLYIGLVNPGVAWWAHLAGMLIGAVWGWWWRVRSRRRVETDLTRGWETGIWSR